MKTIPYGKLNLFSPVEALMWLIIMEPISKEIVLRMWYMIVRSLSEMNSNLLVFGIEFYQ